MNNLFFACRDCRIYVDAGYRWAYWQLEDSGFVKRGGPVNVESVLAAQSYWNPPRDEGARWLYDAVFPSVRQFLLDHKGHWITFGEEDEFATIESDDYFEWMQIGYGAVASPRYLAETLGLNSWEEVREYVEKQKIPPAWWEVTWTVPSPHERAKRKFEELVRQKEVR